MVPSLPRIDEEFSRLDSVAKSEVYNAISDIEDNWDNFVVGDIRKHYGALEVELHDTAERRKITIEIDTDP